MLSKERHQTATGPTLSLGLLFLFSSYTAIQSALDARKNLGRKSNRLLKWILRLCTIALTLIILPLSWIRTEGGLEYYLSDTQITTKSIESLSPFLKLSSADLRGANLTLLPENWRPRAHAKIWFFSEWCDRERLDKTCEGISQEQSKQRLGEWLVHRQTYLDTLTYPNLLGRDLRGARMANAFLPNVDLRYARLDGAIFADAQMEAANLRYANLSEVHAPRVKLQGADLSNAILVNAKLERAHLEEANFTYANMNSADLSFAHMEKAILKLAQLENTTFFRADLKEANFVEARMQRANLSGAQLHKAFFNRARMQGSDLTGAQLGRATLRRARLEGARFRDANLANADLSSAHLTYVDLVLTHLYKANLTATDLRGAHILYDRFIDVKLKRANLQGALIRKGIKNTNHMITNSFAEAKTELAAVKGVDFSYEQISLIQINKMFGDISVTLPLSMSKFPCHWAKVDLKTKLGFSSYPPSDDPFIGRWRGWVEANDGNWPTSTLFVNYKDVTPIPPPPECPLIKDM